MGVNIIYLLSWTLLMKSLVSPTPSSLTATLSIFGRNCLLWYSSHSFVIIVVLYSTRSITLSLLLRYLQAFHKGKCIGTVVCKMGEHRGTFRGYIAMLVVLKPYRGKGIGQYFFTFLLDKLIRTFHSYCCSLFELRMMSLIWHASESCTWLSLLCFFEGPMWRSRLYLFDWVDI